MANYRNYLKKSQNIGEIRKSNFYIFFIAYFINNLLKFIFIDNDSYF